MSKNLKECFEHTNIIFVGPTTSICRTSGKKGCVLYTASHPHGIIVYEDRTSETLLNYNDVTGAGPVKGTAILAVYQLPEGTQPCTLEEIFSIPLEDCEQLWELPRVIDDVAVDEFLKAGE